MVEIDRWPKKDIQLERPTWTTEKKEWREKNEANENMMNKGFRNEKCKIEETVQIDSYCCIDAFILKNIRLILIFFSFLILSPDRIIRIKIKRQLMELINSTGWTRKEKWEKWRVDFYFCTTVYP